MPIQDPIQGAIRIRTPHRHELSAVRHLRQEELVGDQPVPASIKPAAEDLDPQSIYVAAFAGNLVVGVARVNPLADHPGTYIITRVATRKGYRGRGIGTQIMHAAERAAVEKGATTLVLDARPDAEAFYARLGYDRSDDRKPEFENHIPMTKRVKF